MCLTLNSFHWTFFSTCSLLPTHTYIYAMHNMQIQWQFWNEWLSSFTSLSLQENSRWSSSVQSAPIIWNIGAVVVLICHAMKKTGLVTSWTKNWHDNAKWGNVQQQQYYHAGFYTFTCKVWKGRGDISQGIYLHLCSSPYHLWPVQCCISTSNIIIFVHSSSSPSTVLHTTQHAHTPTWQEKEKKWTPKKMPI